MKKVIYTPEMLAILVISEDMGPKLTSQFLTCVWKNEKQHLAKEYTDDLRKLHHAVDRYRNFYADRSSWEADFPKIQRDFESVGRDVSSILPVTNENLELFFVRVRLRILFLQERTYSQMKLRTLLKAYGYQRRTEELVSFMEETLEALELSVLLSNRRECNLRKVKLDDILVFRIK